MARRMRLVAAAVAAGAVMLGSSAVLADAPTPTVGRHSHYVVTADGDRVPVGPDACADGPSIAFDQFHNHGHQGVPGGLGVIVGGPCPAS